MLGEYQAHNVIAYVKNFISNFEKEVEFKTKLFLIAKERGLSKAMNSFSEKKPELICTHFQKIQANLKTFIESYVDRVEPRFSDFNYPE